MRIAIVGAGIAGLGAALLLTRQGHAVTLFEANAYLGGHTATVDVTLEGRTFPVDTGFLVFNDRTYPLLVALFDELGVTSVASEMSFSCRIDRHGLEWAGTNLATLFAQPANALRPSYWQMLADIARFNRSATALDERDAAGLRSLGEFLDAERYSVPFREWYLLPMAAAIWSAPKKDILQFPLAAFVRFCRNHGLLQITDRPIWRTVQGGGRVYVEKIASQLSDVRIATKVRRIARGAAGVDVISAAGAVERFDDVVLACHSDQALALLGDASPRERRLLSHVRYQANRVVLHTDATLLPRSRRTWSAWNCLALDDPSGERPVAVSYLINKLQPLPCKTPVIVTLNPPIEPDAARVLNEFEYSHPLLDGNALAARDELALLQGHRRTWYAGAWLGYGFHEDGLASAHAVAKGIARRGIGNTSAGRSLMGPTMDSTSAADTAVPAIINGEVMHRRMRPAANAFAYPAFCLRLPLSRLSALPGQGVAWNRRGLVSFHDRDHGPRDGTPLAAWMRSLLAREGIAADGEIVLHAFPRMLGYVFNPVSFWVCHTAQGGVAAVLAEVNNTFGETHHYLLAHPHGEPLKSGETLSARKVFHVSPFCDVKGHYTFRFHFGADRWLARIDYFDDDRESALLETHVSGRVQALTVGTARRLMWRYRWFTLAVVARIHWHAVRLWVKRVPFFGKPVAPDTLMTRNT